MFKGSAYINLFVILQLADQSWSTCDPSSSTVDWRMQTVSGKLCYFPFKDGGTTYTDCQDKLGKKWCPTSCNYPGNPAEWDYCKWTKAILGHAQCSGLPNATVSDEPLTTTGEKCTFPFITQDVCVSDCTTENSPDGKAWCAGPSYYLNGTKTKCVYSKSILTDEPSCANLSSSRAFDDPDVYGGSEPGAKCHFPFFFEDACHHDCVSDADTGQLWCATQKSYDPSKKRVFCKYPKNYKSLASPIPADFYRVYAADGKQLRYSTSQNNTDGHPLLILEDPSTSSAAGDQMWEVVPMPDEKIVIRTPHNCPPPGVYHWAVSIDSSSNIVLADRAAKRYEWIFSPTGTANLYEVESSHADHEFNYMGWRTVGANVQAALMSDLLVGGVTFNWKFLKVPANDEIFRMSKCQETTTTTPMTSPKTSSSPESTVQTTRQSGSIILNPNIVTISSNTPSSDKNSIIIGAVVGSLLLTGIIGFVAAVSIYQFYKRHPRSLNRVGDSQSALVSREIGQGNNGQLGVWSNYLDQIGRSDENVVNLSPNDLNRSLTPV